MCRQLVALILLLGVAGGGAPAIPVTHEGPVARALAWEAPAPDARLPVSWQSQQEREREPRNVPAMLAGIGLILIAIAIWVFIRAWTRRPRRPPPE
ncbi:MAG: hypothetical protein Kow0010_02880 [Dehalococcoidia bacterium]